MKATVFLGGGRITGALIAGLRLAGDRRRIVVYDRNPAKLRALQREFRIAPARDLKSAVSSADILIIAVRPASVSELLAQIRDAKANLHARVAVSLAAGIPIKKLKIARIPLRWARAMPSPVCRIGRGLTALTYDRAVPPRDRKRVRALFEEFGEVLEIPESRFDAFCAAYSPSHGYHALATLANAAQVAGLDRKTALAACSHALAEAIAYWRESGESLDELLREAATPGGTAAATLRTLKKHGFERAIEAGLQAAMRQARKNARRRNW
jgi:pyrroline-5-carboxylate reductase